MTKTRCLIVDDEPIAQRIISRYLRDLSEFEIAGICDHALAAREVLQQEDIDLMFLDIEMPKLKGLAFLKTLSNPPQVIITTAHREYALEGFELEVVDYLLKPISFARFVKAINRFQKLSQSSAIEPNLPKKESNRILYVKSDRKTIKIKEADILYIEGMNNYIIIHLAAQSHIVYSSLSGFLTELGDDFLRIHKSFVVNRRKVISYSKEMVEVQGKELPVGKAFKEVLGLL